MTSKARILKHAILSLAVRVVSFIPGLRKGRKNAKNIHLRKEKVHSNTTIPELGILFMTDAHIGGNIDNIDISGKLQTFLTQNKTETTLILHGGDLVSSDGPAKKLSFENSVKVAKKLLSGLEKFQHFSVIGNHDDENSDFPYMKQWLEEKYFVQFLTEPRHAKKIRVGERTICIHGIHTLGNYLHYMEKPYRDMLMDQYIYTLNLSHDQNIVLLHHPDGLEFLLQRLHETGQKLHTPTLFLAGHTHGGMIDVPVLNSIGLKICQTEFGRYKGWYHPEGKYTNTGNWKMYVSTGMGNTPGCDFRINADPEIVLFTL